MSDRVHIFSTGTEYVAWGCYCGRCARQACDIREAIDDAAIGDGRIPVAIKAKVGDPLRTGRCEEYEGAK